MYIYVITNITIIYSNIQVITLITMITIIITTATLTAAATTTTTTATITTITTTRNIKITRTRTTASQQEIGREQSQNNYITTHKPKTPEHKFTTLYQFLPQSPSGPPCEY